MENCSDSIVIASSAEILYDMIADVPRMGRWSPICKACWWDDDSGPSVGAWFTGRNDFSGRPSVETRCEIVTAEPGKEFAFLVGKYRTRWGYTFTPVEGGTKVTESCEFLPPGIKRFEETYGAEAMTQIADRYARARESIGITLAAIKSEAESR